MVLLRYGAVETTETGLNMATGVPSFAAANETAIVEFTSPTTKTRSLYRTGSRCTGRCALAQGELLLSLNLGHANDADNFYEDQKRNSCRVKYIIGRSRIDGALRAIFLIWIAARNFGYQIRCPPAAAYNAGGAIPWRRTLRSLPWRQVMNEVIP